MIPNRCVGSEMETWIPEDEAGVDRRPSPEQESYLPEFRLSGQTFHEHSMVGERQSTIEKMATWFAWRRDAATVRSGQDSHPMARTSFAGIFVPNDATIR